MELNYKEFGQGEPLVILHGLFGSLDNWQSMAKVFSEHYTVFIIDQRNHGRSPHSDEISYQLMAEDLKAFMEQNGIYKANILGHSMGGKTAMKFALNYPDMVDKLIIVDIRPWENEAGHDQIFNALVDLDLSKVQSRKDADELLAKRIPDTSVRQFLLKNMSRNKGGFYEWKMNLDAIHNNYPEILAAVNGGNKYEGQTLFVRGGNSDYIGVNDLPRIHKLFPAAQLETIKGAGHWIHAEAPDQFSGIVLNFLQHDHQDQ